MTQLFAHCLEWVEGGSGSGITRPLLIMAACFAVACRADRKGPASNAPTDTVKAIAAAPANLESTFAYFMRMSLPTRQPDGTTVDSIYGCADVENLSHMVWVADWRMDSANVLGDSAVIHVRLTSVARLREAQDGYRATATIEEIPTIVHLDRSGSTWKVCVNFQDSRRPSDPFVVGGVVPNIQWVPPTLTNERVLQTIDSIRQSRGAGRSDRIDVPPGLESASAVERKNAFELLVSSANEVRPAAHSGPAQEADALGLVARTQPDVSLALIRLLEREQRAQAAHENLWDGYGEEYFTYVVRAVARARDARAASVLVAAMPDSPVLVRSELVALGDAVVAPLVSALKSAPVDDRRDIALTLGTLGDSAKALGLSDRSLAAIRGSLLEATAVEDNLRLRAAAIQGLMSFDGEDIAAQMRNIYDTDRSRSSLIGDKVPYPARALAEKWLALHPTK